VLEVKMLDVLESIPSLQKLMLAVVAAD